MKQLVHYGIPCHRLFKTQYLQFRKRKDIVIMEEWTGLDDDNNYRYWFYQVPGGVFFCDYLFTGYILEEFNNIPLLKAKLDEEYTSSTIMYNRFKIAPNFCLEVDMYVEPFANQYGLLPDFSNVYDLRNLDTLINDNLINIDLEFLPLVAIIGTYLTINIRHASWMNRPVPIKERYPYVVTFQGFLSPVDILETAFQKFLQGKKVFLAREVAFAIRSVMEAKPLKRKQFP